MYSHRNSNIKVMPDVITQVVDDDIVLVSPEQGKALVLNKVGAKIWHLINEGYNIEEIGSHIAQLYNQPLETVSNDILAFITELESKKLISLQKEQ